jgi:limonene-1,2-epoxide hydrolase
MKEEGMSEQENIKLIERFCATWSGPSVDVPMIIEFFTDDAVYHNMPIQPVQGKDAIKGVIEQFMTPFERCDWQVLNIAANGDRVLTERVDKFIGAKNVELPVMGTFDIKDGKISAWRDYFDLGAWTKQMGS